MGQTTNNGGCSFGPMPTPQSILFYQSCLKDQI